MIKKTYKEVKEIVESQGSLLLSSEYINSQTPLKLKCLCGDIFERTLANMSSSKRFICVKCSKELGVKNRIETYENIKDIIEKENYLLLSKKEDYKNKQSKLLLKCPKGHVYEVVCANFLSGNRCVKCYNERTKERLTIPYTDIVRFINSICYKLLTKEIDYVNTKSKISVECSNGHVYTTNINKLKNGRRCAICSRKKAGEKSRVSYEDRLKYVEKFGYCLLTPKEEFTVTNKKYLFKCPKGHIYQANLSDFMQGCRCPICKVSKGESAIKEILEKYNINFKEQYKFKECKFYSELPFDFYLPDYNTCIEYDGKQHFEIVNSWGGFEGFIDRTIRDSIKNIYCRNNKINLIRIPYFKFKEIENIILNKLNQDNTEVTKGIKEPLAP